MGSVGEPRATWAGLLKVGRWRWPCWCGWAGSLALEKLELRLEGTLGEIVEHERCLGLVWGAFLQRSGQRQTEECPV